MNIEAINEWFYDDITARGVSFDGLLPQACKTPLGNMPLGNMPLGNIPEGNMPPLGNIPEGNMPLGNIPEGNIPLGNMPLGNIPEGNMPLGNMPEFELIGNMPEFELIHTPEKMADFQNNDLYRKNWKLRDALLTVSPLQPDKHILVDTYRTEMAKVLSFPCDSECCEHDASCDAWPTRGSCRGLRTLCEDVSRYGDVLTGNNVLDDGKFYDIKKEIYRLTDRVFAALAKCYEVDASGTFAILDELEKRKIISSEARDNFASAAAIAIKLRLSTYIKAGKQGEQLMAGSNEETGNDTPNNEELFHFFFIAIPLYEELQKLKAAGNIPPSLTHSSFYDDSDVTMGHIYCRVLNYDEALKCYDRTLQQDPENLSIEIRRISIALCITKGTEEMDKIRENLDTLLCKIDQSWSEPHRETTPFVNRLDFEEIRQLLEVLLSAFSLFDCPKYFELAGKILAEYMEVKEGRKEVLMMAIAFLKHLPKVFDQQHGIHTAIHIMPYLIDEGVSTKSILFLNVFGELLFNERKFDKAYRCFQRALSMEHVLYGTKPTVNMMKSLYFLGITSFYLSKNTESKFFFELLVQRFELFGGATGRLMVKKVCAMLSDENGYSAKESVCYLEKGLKATTGSRNDEELKLDCILFCKLAIAFHAQHNQEQAWKSALDGKACLGKIVEVLIRAHMTCLLAETLAKIQKTNKGIEILKEEVQKLTSQSQTEEKALCLMKLGELCLEQGLASDAENYYKQALEVMDMQDNKDIFVILECRIGILKAIMTNNRVSEAKTILDDAFILAKELPTSLEKNFFVWKMGKLWENLGDIFRTKQCFEDAIRTYKELSNKNYPLMEFSLELQLGDLAKKVCAEIAMQRSHYDRAAEVLWQLVATGKFNSSTVKLFLLLAVAYKSVDLSETKRLLLESLKVSEIVYGKNKSNETITKIFEGLSDAYFSTKDFQAFIEYRQLLIRMEMNLHLSNPFHDHISQNFIRLAHGSLILPVGIDTVERAYEFLLSAQKDKASTNSNAKTAAARCFTCLGILFYTSGELEKAEIVNEMASQLFSEIHESGERENPPFKTTCDIMKEILTSKKILLSDKIKLSDSITKAVADLRPHHGTLAEEAKTPKNCSDGQENAELFISSSKSREIDELISDAIRAMADDRPSSGIRYLDLALQPSSNWRQKTKILKLRGECNLSRGDFRTAAINFTKATRVYSSETLETRDDLCEYSEVAIGLIKSEMLCQNVACRCMA